MTSPLQLEDYNFVYNKLYVDETIEFVCKKVFEILNVEYTIIDFAGDKTMITEKDVYITSLKYNPGKTQKKYTQYQYEVEEDYGVNFFTNIWPHLYLNKYNKIFLPKIQIFLTARCVLKCKNCANSCNHFRDKTSTSLDKTFEEVKESIDAVFSKIEGIRCISLVGGEPGLCQDVVKQSLEYIYTKYCGRYCRLELYTNMMVPYKKDLYDTFKATNTELQISDYSMTVPKQKAILGKALWTIKKYDIKYQLFPNKKRWYNFSIGQVNNKENTEAVWNKCFNNMPFDRCLDIYDISKLYFCVHSILFLKIQRPDLLKYEKYIDLYDKNFSKKDFVNFITGKCENMIPVGCKYCNGYPDSLEERIQCGEQEDD